MNKKLILAKTYDKCRAGNPVLTVVLIHGIASDSTTYEKSLEYFNNVASLKKVRFVAFDLLGSGKSLKDNELNYDYKDQIEALHNSIKELKLETPLVLVGHSMGALIATKYAADYKNVVSQLILVSAPTYTTEDLKSARFKAEMEAFKKIVAVKDKKYIDDKAFNNEVEKIVLDKGNYKRLLGLKTPTTLIYSNSDQTIMPPNIRKVVRENSKYLNEIITVGTHRVGRDKYVKIREVLEEVLKGDLDA